uniref:Uncharacterized protein n=1 Tax=Arundo donax TaxID=35708 RepID=A0A0A9E4E4_ARUDO
MMLLYWSRCTISKFMFILHVFQMTLNRSFFICVHRTTAI